MTAIAINRETISGTYNRLRQHIRRTPLLSVSPTDFGSDAAELHLKLECLQHSGSFKARGAFTHFLLGSIPDAGVVAASGGNHGAAVAFAAAHFNSLASIFVPEISAPAKQEAIQKTGARLVVGGARYAEALSAADDYAAKSGAKSLHAYDQPETLVGQGTVGLEMEADAPGLTTILVAVGGGGLIGGIAAWYQGRAKIVAVEPETSCCLHAALEANEPVDVDVSGIAADSLGAKRIGKLPFALAQTYVEEVVRVPDDAIIAAQFALWEKTRIVAEPGGAAALAALTSGAYKPQSDERVGVLVCGANTSSLPI
ncbi:MAG: threonine/serine dehydratase [Pseudomonadota bacterium]